MKPSFVLTFSGGKSSLALMALLLFVPILTAPPAKAFGGGNGNPFSNGTFFPNEGTFQTTVRGVNLSGVATFSTGSSSSTSSNSTSSGSFTVSYQGLSYTGNVDATIDPVGGTIAATMEASIARGGKGNATTTVASTYLQTGTTNSSGGQTNVLTSTIVTTVVPGGQTNILTPVTTTLAGAQSMVNDGNGNGHVINSAETVVTTPNGVSQVITLPSTSVTTTNTNSSPLNLPDVITPVFGFEDEMANSIYTDTLYASGSFAAKLKNSYPNQIFSGKGTMEFTAISFDLVPPALVTTTVPISLKGVRLSSTAQSFTARIVQPPSVLTTISVQARTN